MKKPKIGSVVASLLVLTILLPSSPADSSTDDVPRNRPNNAVILDARVGELDVRGGLLVNGTSVFIIIHNIATTFVSPVKIIPPAPGDAVYIGDITLPRVAYILDVPLGYDGEWVVQDNLNSVITKFTVVTWTSGTPAYDNSHVNVFGDTATFWNTINSIYSLESIGDITARLEGDLDLRSEWPVGCSWHWVSTQLPQNIPITPAVAVRNFWVSGSSEWSCDVAPAGFVRYGLFTPSVGGVSGAGASFNAYYVGDDDLNVYGVVTEGPSRVEFCGLYATLWHCDRTSFSVT